MRFKSVALLGVSGILFFGAFVFSFAYWCFLPGFVLLLWGIAEESSARRLFWYGLLTGTLQYAGAFFWVWSTFPIQWMSDAPLWIQFSAIGAYWTLTSATMGIGTGVFAVWARKIITNPVYTAFFVPILWVAFEVLRSFLFSVYALGEGGFLNVGLSYGYLGYLLAEVPLLLQGSALAGVYGLSYLAALLGTLLYLLVVQRFVYKKMAVVVCALFALLCVQGNAVSLHEHTPIGKNVVVIEGWFKNTDEAYKKAEVAKAVQRALTYAPDVILMPEDMRFGDTFASPDAFFTWMEEQTQKEDIVLVDNGPAIDAQGNRVLRAFLYDQATHATYFFDKRYLVPQGEFISYLHSWILSLFMTQERLAQVHEFARFRPGVINDSRAYPDHLPGVLFCFETMVPFAVKRAEHFRHPEFIAHPISHAWFENPFSLESQLVEMLKVSAVWNNIPIVSAGSMTQSRVFLETGSVDEGELLWEEAHWKIRQFSL